MRARCQSEWRGKKPEREWAANKKNNSNKYVTSIFRNNKSNEDGETGDEKKQQNRLCKYTYTRTRSIESLIEPMRFFGFNSKDSFFFLCTRSQLIRCSLLLTLSLSRSATLFKFISVSLISVLFGSGWATRNKVRLVETWARAHTMCVRFVPFFFVRKMLLNLARM